LEAIGAKADAEKSEVIAKVAALKGVNIIACSEVLQAIGANSTMSKDEVLRIVASLKTPGDVAVQLSQQVATLTAKLTAMEQQDLVTLALKEGKTSPDELEKWGRDLALKNPESFKLIVLSRPAGSVIPVTEIVIAKDQPGVVSTDVQQAVNRMMGVSEEMFKKYNK
jgi:phage I-like protein